MKTTEKIVRTKLAKKILELFGWKYLCKYLEYGSWRVKGYVMTKEQRI